MRDGAGREGEWRKKWERWRGEEKREEEREEKGKKVNKTRKQSKKKDQETVRNGRKDNRKQLKRRTTDGAGDEEQMDSENRNKGGKRLIDKYVTGSVEM